MEATLDQLQTSLQDVSSGVFNGREPDLFHAIEALRPQLVRLLHFGDKSQVERTALKDGPGISRNGLLYKPNAAAAERIIFLSDHLDTSETYCASIIDRVVLHQPNLTPIAHVELATRDYYAIRDSILAVWNLLLGMLVIARERGSRGGEVKDGEEVEEGSLIWRLAELAREIASEGNLLNQILSQVDSLAQRVDFLQKKLVDATSQTTTQTTLRDEVLQGELAKVKEQRRQLGALLVLLSETRELSPKEILHFLQWISKFDPNDEQAAYATTAALLSLSPTRLHSAMIQDSLTDKFLVSVLLSRFDQGAVAEWKSKPTRAALQLQTSLFFVECRARDPAMCDAQKVTVDAVETLASEAMESNAFDYLHYLVLAARGRDSLMGNKAPPGAGSEDAEQIPTTEAGTDLVEEASRPKVYMAVESTIVGLLTSLPNVLKKLKHRQEDVGLAARKPPPNLLIGSRSAMARLPDVVGASTASAPRRTDIATLFRLVGSLYDALPPESALKFWISQPHKSQSQRGHQSRSSDSIHSRLPSFLRWAAEVRGEIMVPAVYEMLAGLSKGTSCSENAYNFLSTGGVASNALSGLQSSGSSSYGGGAFSWSVLFGSLGYYAESLPNPRLMQQYRQQGPLPEIRVEEANLLVSFLKLLRVVAQWSVPARLALADHTQYRAIPAMLQLATCRVPLELKGAIYEAVSAFCSPGGGASGAELCRNTWLMLEQLQVLDSQSVPSGVGATHGIKFELVEVEIANKVYPCSSAFIRLLNSLIHTPKDLSLKQVLFSASASSMSNGGGQTIPEGLGHPYRHIPLTPYVSFVVDDVLWLNEDAFKTPTEQWLIKDLCLKFIEKSLAAYDLESLPVALQTISTMGSQVIRPWIIHPGFDLIVRIFSDTRLRSLLGDFLAFGVEKLEKGTIKTVFFQSCMRRVVRIIHRVLDVQSFFLDMLVPTLQSFDFSPLLASSFAPGQLSALDRHLLFNHVLVERVALLVIIPDQELQLLAVRILGMLALSPHFTVMDQQASRMARRLNRLAIVIQNSEDSIRINDGFAALLGISSAESGDFDELELRIGAGAPDPDETSSSSSSLDDDLSASLTHTIRLEIIDLFLKNSERGRPAPNIAHLLLGFDVATSSKNEMTIQDPSAINSTKSCFHVIAEMLSDGIPFLDPAQRRREEKERGNLHGTVLYLKAPLLAEKCHKLLYQLCSHELTSKPASRYLRTREDYFARNLAALPVRAPEVLSSVEGMVNYADGVSVDSNCRSLTSFLRMRSWLLEVVALELHLLTDDRQFPRAGRLLDILFGTINKDAPTVEREEEEDIMNDEFFAGSAGPGNALVVFAPGQSQIRTLEIFQSFDLVWQETNVLASEVPLIFFVGLDYTPCLRVAESGAEIIDREALITLLSTIRASKQESEVLVPEAQTQLIKETRYMLESCVKENNRREIEHAKSMGFESWRRVVNISLSKCFDRLPQDSREGLLFDILQEIPPVIRRPTTAVPSAIVLSEVTVMLITKLREDRSHRILVQTLTEDDPSTGVGVTSVPEDRFHALLRSLFESVLTPGMPEVVRGNLYSSIVNHLQLVQTITAARKQSYTVDDEEDEMEESLFGSKSMELQQRFPALETGCVNIINSLAERVIPILCRDSIDGSEVWKTVAFTLLETLIRLSRIQRQHRILHLLARGGYLNNFAVGFKEADEELQSLLIPDPTSLNALYVHESKMAFLIRTVQTRSGAERLLSTRILSILAQCDFIDSRPENSQAYTDAESFLPPAVERWHQLVKPTLQLVASILSAAGSTNGEAVKQGTDFVIGHRETLRSLLLESGRFSLSHLAELSLIVTICSYVAAKVDHNELASRSSPFTPLHEALMSLSAKVMYTGRWGAVVVPSNDRELAESRTAVNVFQAKILESTEELQRSMLTYAITISDASSTNFRPIFTPSIFVPREGDPNPHPLAHAPSVADAIIALREVIGHVTQSLAEVSSYSLKLLNQDATGLDELEEIALSSLEGAERLEPYQKRALVFAQLEEMMQQRVKDSIDYINSLEMLLLLIWRHVDYYINARATSQTNAEAPGSKSNDKPGDLAVSQALVPRQALNESKSGWGSSLFSPFRRKAETSSPGPGASSVGMPLATSTMNTANGKSVLGVSALVGRGAAARTSDDIQADMFRAEAANALEPLLDKLEALQLPDDVPALDFRVRGPHIRSFIKRIRALVSTASEEDMKEMED